MELDKRIIPIIQTLADKEEVSFWGAVNLLLCHALRDYAHGKVDFEPHIEPAKRVWLDEFLLAIPL
jgi:hypothetical protein